MYQLEVQIKSIFTPFLTCDQERDHAYSIVVAPA